MKRSFRCYTPPQWAANNLYVCNHPFTAYRVTGVTSQPVININRSPYKQRDAWRLKTKLSVRVTDKVLLVVWGGLIRSQDSMIVENAQIRVCVSLSSPPPPPPYDMTASVRVNCKRHSLSTLARLESVLHLTNRSVVIQFANWTRRNRGRRR